MMMFKDSRGQGAIYMTDLNTQCKKSKKAHAGDLCQPSRSTSGASPDSSFRHSESGENCHSGRSNQGLIIRGKFHCSDSLEFLDSGFRDASD